MFGGIQFKNRDCVAHSLFCVKQLVSESIQLSLLQVIVGALRILQIVVRVNRSLDSRIMDGLVKSLCSRLPRQNVRFIREDVLDRGVYVQSLTVPLFVSMMTVTLSVSRRPINALNPA